MCVPCLLCLDFFLPIRLTLYGETLDNILAFKPKTTIQNSSTVESNVSLSAFAYLYSELVQYHQNRVDSISELERRLESAGYGVGLKVLELLAYRSREVSFTLF